MELIMKIDIDLKESGLDLDKVKGNLAQFVRDLLMIGAAKQEIGLALREVSVVETDGKTQETDGLISRKAVNDAIEELLQSPYVNDSYFTGRKEAIEIVKSGFVNRED